MDVVMSGLSYQTCLVYLDDIIVFSHDIETHLERLRGVLARIRAVGLGIKPAKCRFLQASVSFLGHVISATGISTDPRKIETVKDWPVPSCLRDVRAFLGLASYYRRFVKGFAKIASPLHEMTRKNARFTWTTVCQEAFEQLKLALSTPPVLCTPDDESPFILDTDASDLAMGAVLSQVQEGVERVVAYASRTFNRVQRNYCVTRKELLAVVTFLRQFKQYLYGRHFTVRTDHSALTFLRKSKELIGQSGRWVEFIEEFDFEIVHRPGTSHANADAMSRVPCQKGSCICHDMDEPKENRRCTHAFIGGPADGDSGALGCDHDEIVAEQQVDPDLSVVIKILSESEVKPPWDEVSLKSEAVKSLWMQWSRLAMKSGILCRRFESADGSTIVWQVIVPASLRARYVRSMHEGITGGHLGRKKTEAQLALRAYWPGWKSEVSRVLRQCSPCAQYHRGSAPRHGKLKPLASGAPWERISLDVTGKHPKSKKGNEYILTAVDHFTKWAEAFTIRDHTAPTVARVLVTNIILKFGCPKQILTDRGPEFESELFRQLCSLLEVDKIRTTGYKPSTNGAVERFHRTLNSMLAKRVCESQRDWDEHVPVVMAAYRASRHEATGFSPNRLVFGRENVMPVDIAMGMPIGEEVNGDSYDDYVSLLQEKMQTNYALAREHLGVAAERRKRTYDVRVRAQEFKVGDWVWYLYPRRYVGRSPKWQKTYTGPFLVVREIPPLNLVIQRSKRAKMEVVHVDKLKKCYGETPRSWLVDDVPHDGGGSEPKREGSLGAAVGEAVQTGRQSGRGRVLDEPDLGDAEGSSPDAGVSGGDTGVSARPGGVLVGDERRAGRERVGAGVDGGSAVGTEEVGRRRVRRPPRRYADFAMTTYCR
jgi:transposase InsO family protein